MALGPSAQRMRNTLDAIEAWNEGINAIVALREADALMPNEAADADGTRGVHGIPLP